MQSLEYFWALQRISLATLSEQAYDNMLSCFSVALLALQRQALCPVSSTQPEALVLVTVATALLCQLTSLAPPSQRPRAARLLLGCLSELPRFHHPGTIPFISLDAGCFRDAAQRATDADGCVATQLLLAYISHECHATMVWLQVSAISHCSLCPCWLCGCSQIQVD